MTKTSSKASSNVFNHAIRGLTAAAVLVAAQPALANMPAPAEASYESTVDGNEVTICPRGDYGGLEFPAGGQMLRLDTHTDEVVVLGEELDEQGCFVDGCVPEGRYEYGLAEPFSCVGMDWVDLMVEVEVEQSLPTECLPPDGLSEPQAYEGTVPWAGGATRVDCGDGPASNYSYSGDEMSSGCSLSGVSSTLWGPYAIAFIAGLALMGASRRRRRDRGARR